MLDSRELHDYNKYARVSSHVVMIFWHWTGTAHARNDDNVGVDGPMESMADIRRQLVHIFNLFELARHNHQSVLLKLQSLQSPSPRSIRLTSRPDALQQLDTADCMRSKSTPAIKMKPFMTNIQAPQLASSSQGGRASPPS